MLGHSSWRCWITKHIFFAPFSQRDIILISLQPWFLLNARRAKPSVVKLQGFIVSWSYAKSSLLRRKIPAKNCILKRVSLWAFHLLKVDLLPLVVNHEIMTVEKYRCHQDDHFFCIEMGDTLFRIVYKLCSAKPFSTLLRGCCCFLAHFTQAVKFLERNDIRFQKCNCLHQSVLRILFRNVFSSDHLFKYCLHKIQELEVVLGASHLMYQ